MSMRRSLAPRMFLFLPNLDSLLRAPTLFSSVFVYFTFLKFYRFYEFFWAVVILTKLCMWTFIICFRCWLLTSLHVIIHSLLFYIHGFTLLCLDLGVPTYAMYRSGLALIGVDWRRRSGRDSISFISLAWGLGNIMLQNILEYTSLQTTVVYTLSQNGSDTKEKKLHYVIFYFLQQI